LLALGLWKAQVVANVAGTVSPVLRGLIRELDRAAPTDLVEVCRTWVINNLGVHECALLLADYSETTLEPVPGLGGGTDSFGGLGGARGIGVMPIPPATQRRCAGCAWTRGPHKARSPNEDHRAAVLRFQATGSTWR
jgi:hypothetical protein